MFNFILTAFLFASSYCTQQTLPLIRHRKYCIGNLIDVFFDNGWRIMQTDFITKIMATEMNVNFFVITFLKT